MHEQMASAIRQKGIIYQLLHQRRPQILCLGGFNDRLQSVARQRNSNKRQRVVEGDLSLGNDSAVWSYILMVLWSRNAVCHFPQKRKISLKLLSSGLPPSEGDGIFCNYFRKTDNGGRCTGSESYVHILFTLCSLFVRFLFTLGAHLVLTRVLTKCSLGAY